MTSPWADNSPADTLKPRTVGYRADQGRRGTVYFLAAAYVLFSLLTMAPAALYFDRGATPGWAQLVLFVSLLQLAYALWLALVPDWSSLWVATLSLALVATLYATGVAITATARPDSELLLDLAELIRTQGNKPALWCSAIVLLASLLAYLFGLVSHRWHKAYRRMHPMR